MAVREMTMKGDPMLRARLPGTAMNMFHTKARENKRRPQEQFIKSIADTFNNQHRYEASFEEILPNLKKIYKQ
jgi:hypothetical protein